LRGNGVEGHDGVFRVSLGREGGREEPDTGHPVTHVPVMPARREISQGLPATRGELPGNANPRKSEASGSWRRRESDGKPPSQGGGCLAELVKLGAVIGV